VRVREAGGRLWVWWTPGDGEILNRVLPLPGVELYVRRDGAWFRTGHRLPSAGVPDEAGARPLSSLLTPAPVAPLVAEYTGERVRMTLVRDGRVRPATLLQCGLEDLVRWADGATSRTLESLEAAYCGEVVLVRGERLPPMPGGERWWGGDVLVPLGFRPEPELAGDVLRQVLGLADGEVALLDGEGAEVVPGGAFGPVSRAGIRLAARGQR
jgi:hypothetical protein